MRKIRRIMKNKRNEKMRKIGKIHTELRKQIRNNKNIEKH